MTRLVIRLLGGFEAVLDGRPVTGFESDKVRALLAYLALHAGHPQRREILTGLLWPDSPDTSARASLRNALANLRHAIGDHQTTAPLLCASRQAITFEESADFCLDIADFNHALQKSIATSDQDHLYLESAITLYRGPFLDGLSVASIPFQEWLLFERERLNRQIVDALRRLTVHYAEDGQLDKALNHAWRQVELEPWEEEGQRLLIRLLAASGRRSEALAQYARCCVMLREMLDVEPSAETVALHNQILAGEIPAASSMPPHNLPLWLTPLVGREDELDWVLSQLDDPHSRLITLTGPGGIGKTHLAFEAVKERLKRFPDGAFLVSLAALPSSGDIAPVLAQVLNLPPLDQSGLYSQLIDYLRPRTLLLILDSFEFLIAAPGLASQTGSRVVNSLLQEAPRLKILVTSRTPLNLHGEHLLTLEGLDFPLDQQESQSIAGAAPDDYSAITLFLASAHRLSPRYIPTEADLAEIGRICRQVDGMPLAILLAASWIELLAPGQIAAEIDRDIDFLTVDSLNIPQRHRSLRAVFDHSWRLLSDSEQKIFQSLSVFRGGFTRAAAQSVAGASAQALRSLAGRSILQRLPREHYTLHPLLRHYAAEKLAGDPDLQSHICYQHSAFYTAFCHDWLERFNGQHQQAAIAELSQDINNLQIAWEWAVTNRELPLLAQSLDALCTFYNYHSRYQKGLAAGQAAANLVEKDRSPAGLLLRARSLSWQGVFSAGLGNLDQAISLSQEGLAVLQDRQLAAQETNHEKAFALLQLARQLTQRDLNKAGLLAHESLTLYRELADQRGTAAALETVGQVAWLTADYHNTYSYLQECLQLRRNLNDSHGMAAVLGTLGFVCFQMGQFDQAEAFLREGIRLKQELGDLAGAADALFNLAMTMLWLGEFEDVDKLLAPAIASFTRTGAANEAARLQALQVMAQTLLGRYTEAVETAEVSLYYARNNGLEREMGILLWVMGYLSVAAAEYDIAEKQLLESTHILQSLGLLDILASAQVARAYAALGVNDLSLAYHHFSEALPRRPDAQSNGVVLLALPGIALLMARSGKIALGIELDALAARYPLIANSRFFEEVARLPLAALSADVPRAVVAQATARGQKLDLETAVTEILIEMTDLSLTAK